MTDPIRVAFLGNDAWSVPPLEALADAAPAISIVLVVTRDPRPARRGSGTIATPVADLARRRGLPVLETPTVRTAPGATALRAAAADVAAVVAYGELLPPAVLRSSPFGAVNLHFSLLPRWRGAAPVQRAIMAGDPTTGVTTITMDEGLDTGPILAQAEEPIGPGDDAGSLGQRLAVIGARLLVRSIEGFVDGSLVPRPQAGPSTSAPKITAADRVIDWSHDADGLVRRVRGLAPAPGATTRLRDRDLKVLRAETVAVSGTPGVVSAVDELGIVVGTGGGSVRLLRVAPAGRRPMSGADLARGTPVGPGERFG